MYSNALRFGIRQLLPQAKPFQSATKYVAVTGIHTSPNYETLGEVIQRLRFKYYHDPGHHLKYDKWAKIFTFEGNIKSGKSALAEKFAEKMDLRFFPSADYTYEITAKERLYRPEEVEWLMRPESVYKKLKNLSLDRFYTNPEDWAHLARYQAAMIKARFYQYADAMVHLIRTGQGVVLDRSFYGLPVFEHAFKEMKWVNKEVLDYFGHLRMFMEKNFLRPHVVLYLDVSPEQCLEEIKKSGTPAEKHISVEYLNAIEEGYRRYFTEADRFGSKVIEFDWSTPATVDEVIMNLDHMPSLSHEFNHWDKRNVYLKKMMRNLSDNFMLQKMSFLFCPIEEMWEPNWAFYCLPEYRSSRPWKEIGFDLKEDKWLWLKEGTYKRDHLL